MGVPFYFYNLYKKYNKNYSLVIDEQSLRSIDIDYLFLDYNSLIHPCARNVMDREQSTQDDIETLIIQECIMYTQSILNKIQPKELHIMIDGVAPRGKVNQQRERRYKSHFMREESVVWDTNKITPGTQFMSKLSRALKDQFKLGSSRVFISDAGEHGEGEHKMMKVIHELPKSSTICIYGLDADLIMLSMLSSRADNIILLRHNDEEYTFLRVCMLRVAVYSEIVQLLQEQGTDFQIQKDNAIADYVFLCFLVGNDFLPSLPNLNLKHNAMEVLVKSYCKSIVARKSSLTTKGEMNLDVFGDIISDISNLEQHYFSKIFYRKTNYKKRDDTAPENVCVLWEDCIKYDTPNFKKRHYMFYGIENEKQQLFLNYIEGLCWVWGYYNLHSHDNWTWFYKFHSAPFASDLAHFIKTSKAETKRYLTNNANLTKSDPLTPLQQLMIVLPEQSLLEVLQETYPALSAKLARLLRSHSSVLNGMYPNMITLDMMNKDQLWQSKVMFATSNVDFVKVINTILTP